MKNLANCKPSEFLKQSNKIKRSVEKWLTATKVLEIRKAVPTLEEIPDTATDEEKAEIKKRNDKLVRDQAKRNISDMLDSMLEEHPEETLELLALMCFVEPENVDDYPTEDYLTSISEMLGSQAVISFFTSLARWGVLNI